MLTPKFKHDCELCEFYGYAHFMSKPCDVYICDSRTVDSPTRTIVCRFSDEPSNYASGALFVCECLSSIDKFALSHGLELTDGERRKFQEVCLRYVKRSFSISDYREYFPKDGEEKILGEGNELNFFEV